MADDAQQGGFGTRPEEFDRLYEEYFPRVYRFVHRRVNEPAEAERATRAVFLELIESLEGMSEAELASHILRIARRQLEKSG